MFRVHNKNTRKKVPPPVQKKESVTNENGKLMAKIYMYKE